MEPLKEMFNLAFYRNFAQVFREVYPQFNHEGFYEDVTEALQERALNERLRHTSLTLKKHLPQNYKKAVGIMKDAAPLLQRGYTALVLPDYVGLFGKHDLHTSLEALKYFTVFGSSEFAIREFLKTDITYTLREMEKWAEDPDPHVRRLSSEGSRPRLPWSFRLDPMVKDPSITKNILYKLRCDNHLYVKKSVANHLNDISKDHPEYLVNLVSKWDMDNSHTKWIIRHACRTLIKKGFSPALNLFSVNQHANVVVRSLKIEPLHLVLGNALELSFVVVNADDVHHRLVIDYAITYVRLNRNSSRKVFKLKEIGMAPGEQRTINKKQVFRDFSTRVHHAGKHLVEVIINGNVVGQKSFYLDLPKAL